MIARERAGQRVFTLTSLFFGHVTMPANMGGTVLDEIVTQQKDEVRLVRVVLDDDLTQHRYIHAWDLQWGQHA